MAAALGDGDACGDSGNGQLMTWPLGVVFGCAEALMTMSIDLPSGVSAMPYGSANPVNRMSRCPTNAGHGQITRLWRRAGEVGRQLAGKDRVVLQSDPGDHVESGHGVLDLAVGGDMNDLG